LGTHSEKLAILKQLQTQAKLGKGVGMPFLPNYTPGDNPFSNLSVPFQNAMTLDTHESAKRSSVLSFPNS